MELMLQFGYGMMEHSRRLLDSWGGGTVILSPRDLKDDQLRRMADDIRKIDDGQVLLDPQFYLPYADHQRLVGHDYWPTGYDSGGFWLGDELAALLEKIGNLNDDLGASQTILPGLFAQRVDEDWLARQQQIAEEARSSYGSGKQLLATVALGADAVRNDDDVHDLLDVLGDWAVDGIYLVCEHPNGDYLVKDPTWMTNVLDLVAGVRLKERHVVVGYCNHQMLALASAGANAIASGTWMNVRSFPPEKFRTSYEDEIRQRTTWYYAPQALSEYKVPFLDIAKKQGVLDDLKPSGDFPTAHCDILFEGPQPTTVGFSEQAAFRHYLDTLRAQTQAARKPTFDETTDEHDRVLDAAETLLGRLHAVGVRGQMRDFRDCIDVNRAALSVLRSTRGAMMKRSWAAL